LKFKRFAFALPRCGGFDSNIKAFDFNSNTKLITSSVELMQSAIFGGKKPRIKGSRDFLCWNELECVAAEE
jgi:hypothetical protein